MKHWVRFLIVAVVVGLPAEVWAINSVVVESKEVAPGATGVTIGVYVTNDVHLSALDLPLEMREITPGSFFTSFSFTIQGRVGASGLMDVYTIRYFDEPVANTCSGPVSNSYGLPAPVDFVSPDALEYVGMQAWNPMLAPGTDGSPGSGTPSFLLTFDVTSVSGSFEIDTCCTTPANHLIFVDGSYNPVLPSFQRGGGSIHLQCVSRTRIWMGMVLS